MPDLNRNSLAIILVDVVRPSPFTMSVEGTYIMLNMPKIIQTG
jgi:hypothetical protein